MKYMGFALTRPYCTQSDLLKVFCDQVLSLFKAFHFNRLDIFGRANLSLNRVEDKRLIRLYLKHLLCKASEPEEI
jgi:hypothetical protein